MCLLWQSQTRRAIRRGRSQGDPLNTLTRGSYAGVVCDALGNVLEVLFHYNRKGAALGWVVTPQEKVAGTARLAATGLPVTCTGNPELKLFEAGGFRASLTRDARTGLLISRRRSARA